MPVLFLIADSYNILGELQSLQLRTAFSGKLHCVAA
jgi:hypothetical protein